MKVVGIAACLAIGIGLLTAASPAKASDTYRFQYYSNNLSIFGTFTLNGTQIVSGSLTRPSGIPAQNYNLISGTITPSNTYAGTLAANTVSILFGSEATYRLSFQGTIYTTATGFVGPQVQNRDFPTFSPNSGFTGTGDFLAFSTASSGTSGGAPSPKVNIILSLVLLGGVLGLLRHGRHKQTSLEMPYYIA